MRRPAGWPQKETAAEAAGGVSAGAHRSMEKGGRQMVRRVVFITLGLRPHNDIQAPPCPQKKLV